MDWTQDVENLLVVKQENCLKYKYLHESQVKKYQKRVNIFNIFNITLVSLTATSSIVILLKPEDLLAYIVNVSNAVLLYITAMLKYIQQNFDYEKLVEKHRSSAIRYTSLNNNISSMLSLQPNHRDPATDYLDWVNNQYLSLFLDTPDIDQDIVVSSPSKKLKCDQVVLTLDEINKSKVKERNYEINRFINFN
jgi:hypothetical protein